MEGRKNLGRQKIKMEKIHNLNHLNVTFSKRRAGLFKKAHELSVMCGAEVGLICFSPAGKAFSFGNPNLAHVMNRFENGGGPAISDEQLVIDLNAQLALIESQLEVGRKIGEERDKRCELMLSRCWWREENRDKAGLEELQHLVEGLENFKCRLTEEAAKVQAAEDAFSINVNLPLDLYGNYPNNSGADPFAAGTSAKASSSGNYGSSNNGFGPRGSF